MTEIAEVDSGSSLRSRRPKSRRRIIDPVRSGAINQAFPADVIAKRRFGLFGLSFIVCVVLPTLVFTSYFVFVAPHEYRSDAKIVVRFASEDATYAPVNIQNPIKQLPGSTNNSLRLEPTANLPKTKPSSGVLFGSNTAASPEIYMVGDYIRSRAIIQDLGGKEFLRKIYDNPNVDSVARLPWPISLEHAWEYWNAKITATIDTQADSLTLSVRAFTPQDAVTLAQKIIEKSEHLVNSITEGSRRDALKRAEEEVKTTRIRLAKAQLALRQFRDTSNSVDPNLSATSANDTLTALVKDKIDLEINRSSLEGAVVAADAPTRRLLDAQIEAKDKQIKQLQSEMTSQTRDDALSGKLAKFQELELENEFAQNQYSTAQNAYQQARVQLAKQQLYLAMVTAPTTPEDPAYPRKLLDSALSFAFFLVLWGMITLVVAAIFDHVDYKR